jgi:hypothetical protein
MYIDPASLPSHLIDALIEQSGLVREKALHVARIYESLRAETPQSRETYARVVQLDEESGLFLRDRLREIVDDIIKFLREYSAVSVDSIEGYAQFETVFKNQLLSMVGARVGYALIRSLEINSLGDARIVPKRFTVKLDDRVVESSGEESETEYRVRRAIWIINTLRTINYRGLSQDERTQIEDIARMEEDEITVPILTVLEDFLIRSTPDYEYWSTDEGREKVLAHCRDRINGEYKRLETVSFPGLEPRDIDFLGSYHNDPDTGPDVIAVCLRILAKSARASAGVPA